MKARRLAPLLALAAFAACARDFRVSGSITVATHLQGRLPKTNSVLFVIAKNAGGVPVAVHRIVNPQFPVDYVLTSQDLVVPDTLPSGPLTLEVEMNTRGDVGTPAKGDLRGEHPDPISNGDRGVHVVIEKVL